MPQSDFIGLHLLLKYFISLQSTANCGYYHIQNLHIMYMHTILSLILRNTNTWDHLAFFFTKLRLFKSLFKSFDYFLELGRKLLSYLL